MAWSGVADLAFTLALIGLIWVAGAILIKASDIAGLRRAAARHAHQRERRAGLANAASAHGRARPPRA